MNGSQKAWIWAIGLAVLASVAGAAEAQAPIDREALVTRHNPVVRAIDYDAPLTVGNGGFAFTVDATGLQTFAAEYYRRGIPAETMARWAWHTDPNPAGYQLADANREYVTASGRKLGFPTNTRVPAADWLRQNPHDRALTWIGLVRNEADAGPLKVEALSELEQTLDLWRGVITSRYRLGGTPVVVTTAAHPARDAVAVRIESAALEKDGLAVEFAFPRGYDRTVKNTPPLDWSRPESYRTEIVERGERRVTLRSTIDDAAYTMTLQWEGAADFAMAGPHHFRLVPGRGEQALSFVVEFSRAEPALPLPDAAETVRASVTHWEAFWRKAGMLDLSGSTDPRAAELERRVVLSQYLTAVQLAGEVPPQESGLTCSTWYGKHHTEMIWWHAAHFALWNQGALLAKNLEWYQARLPEARALAQSRGLRGARWAKMVGPDGRESPGGNPLIVWNQPHLVYLGELLYRETPTRETLERYRELVFETAECLASMVEWDATRERYVLGPPLWIAQEIHDQATSQNPSFELAYWRWALGVAQTWRERLGLAREKSWDDVLAKLSPLPVRDGKYVALESAPDTWTNLASRHDHPEMLMPLGFLPEAPGVDRATMGRTLDAVLATWDWETKIWGWDYPMIAMTATRLGRPEVAVEVLLRNGPNNLYMANGHCPQRSDEALSKNPAPGARRREIAVYLPANGALLSAVALMVAGWDGCAEEYPGFPKDGTWKVRAEGFHRSP